MVPKKASFRLVIHETTFCGRGFFEASRYVKPARLGSLDGAMAGVGPYSRKKVCFRELKKGDTDDLHLVLVSLLRMNVTWFR